MKNLEIIENENGKTAVLCSQLYKELGLDAKSYSRWTEKNMLNNPFAIDGEDFIILSTHKGELRNKRRALSIKNYEINTNSHPLTLHNAGIRTRNRQRNQDFVLSLDFAKHLAMMCRTKQGYNVRTYFIEFEEIHREKESKIIEVLKKRLSIYERMEQIRLIRLELNKEVRELKTVLASTPQIIDTLTNQLTLNFN